MTWTYDELAQQWLDGNQTWVLEALCDLAPVDVALTTLALVGRLPEREAIRLEQFLRFK